MSLNLTCTKVKTHLNSVMIQHIIIKQVLFSIESRLSNISSSQKIFNESTSIHQETLKKSGYDYKLKYQNNTLTTTSKQQQKTKIIWSNTPYNMNVSTNVGRYFLNLDNKHFPPHHKFSKIFNRNNTKNMKPRINIHNKTLTNPQPSAQAKIM